MMAQKLGLNGFMPETDKALIDDLISMLPIVETDMTIFFRQLAKLNMTDDNFSNMSDSKLLAPLLSAYYRPEQLTPDYRLRFGNWLRSYIKRARKDQITPEVRRQQMNAVNPKYVLRTYLAQLAIDKAEEEDFSKIHELLELLRHPYDEQPDKEAYAIKRPDWARNRPGCSMLSCSS